MAVSLAFMPEKLNVRTAGRHRPVAQQQRPQSLFRKHRISDSDRPARMAMMRAPSDQTAVPAMQQE